MLKKHTRNAVLLLVGAWCLAASMWFYVKHILVPMQMADSIAHERPRGNLSDLYPRWFGSRELLLHGRDPYSAEITREIQIGYYGRPLDSSRPNDPKDQEGFVYPVYVVFVLAPSILFPFSSVQAGFLWFLILVIAGSIVWWFKALQWQPQYLTALTALAFALGNFPAIQGLALRQLSILVAGILSLSFSLMVRRKFVLAGLLLALSTIKPQLAVPLASWFGLWALSNWKERKKFLLSFLCGMFVLFFAAQWVLPGWIAKFYHAVLAYQQYTGGMTSADVLFGPALGRIITGLLIIAAIIVSWRLRSKIESSTEFAFGTCFILATTVAIVPIFAPYNQLLLFPGLLFLIQHRRRLNPKKLWQKALLSFVVVAICWQWIVVIIFVAIYCFVSKAFVIGIWKLPFYTSIPLPIILMCLLYVCMAAIEQCHMMPGDVRITNM